MAAESRKRKANNTDDESKKILDIIKTDYVGARQAIKSSNIDPKNVTNIPYHKLLLYVMTNLPDINEPTELDNINIFFTGMQEDAQGRPITKLDPNELKQYRESLQKIYGKNIPNIYYHKETTDKQGVKWPLVLTDMGIAAAARYRKDKLLNKKPCPYGNSCYRMHNPHHMNEYIHGGTRRKRTLRKRTRKRFLSGTLREKAPKNN